MSLFKDDLPLRAQSDQRVHVEEAPVAKLLVRALPIRQAVVLLIQKFVQQIGIGVHFLNAAIDRLAGKRLLSAKPLQQPADHDLVTVSRQHGPTIAEIRRRKPAEARCKEL